MSKYIKPARKIWYIYKNGYNIGQCNDQMTARDFIKQWAGVAVIVNPISMEVFQESISWKDKLTGDLYQAKYEEIKR